MFGRKKQKRASGKKGLESILGHVDETYSNLPMKLRLQIEAITQGLSEFGPRKLKRRGIGTEFFEARDFVQDQDEITKINARLSARAGRSIIVEKEAEIPQHFYIWRDPSDSMNYASDPDSYTKKEAAEIMLLAFAKHLAKNEEMIGILDRKGLYRGGKAPQQMAERMVDVSILTGDMPMLERKLPKNSTVVLFSDFLMDEDTLLSGLEHIQGAGLRGYLVMVLDPQEIAFDFKGHVEFEGTEGEGVEKFKRAESKQREYHDLMAKHIRKVEDICHSKGFKFIIQTTDEPLYDALMQIYGLKSGKTVYHPPLKPKR